MKPLLIIDFDSTFIRDETLDEISKLISLSDKAPKNLYDKITDITHQAMNGALDFSDALKIRIQMLNLHRKDINEVVSVLKNRVSLSFIKNKNRIRALNENIYIISGGFKEIITPIVKDYGIHEDHVFANKFRYDENGYIAGVDETSMLSYSDGKIRALQSLNLDNGAYAIGDGSTDLEMKQVDGVKAFICLIENINRVIVSEKADYIASDLDEVFKIIERAEHHG